MRYLLLAAGLIFAALFGLSAMADTGTVMKYQTVAVSQSAMPAMPAMPAMDVRLCTPSTAQADRVTFVKSPELAGGNARSALIAPSSAASGGARLGVGTALIHSSYT